MADESIHVTYAEGFGSLVETLENLERPGNFEVSGKHETPMPVLSIEGMGQLSFPVPAAQARELIASAAERAPYGRGDQTLVDESVRRVWQVPTEKISLQGKGWASRFSDLVARVAEGLGLTPKEVRAEFYKLLVYDEGGFFLPHRDTEKAGGMFGTLVIALPSAHEGGELLVRHAGRESVVDLRGTDPGEVGFAAFYADCEHEVRPVLAGYRVCLIFNLILSSRQREGGPQPPDEMSFVEKAAHALQSWVARGDGGPAKVAWLLDHKYTASGLSFSALKGRDAVVAKVLLEAAKISGCAFHLGIVHIEESGWAEYTGWGGQRHWDDEEDDDEDYEVGEVCDSQAFIDEWRDSGDNPVAFGKIPLGANEVLPPESLDGEEPDGVHFSEATGNAGADFERCYLRAAIVLWPESSFDKICLSAGVEAAIARLGVLARSGATEAVERLTNAILKDWKGDSEDVDRLLRVLNEHGDADLLEHAAQHLVIEFYDGSQNETLAATARILQEDSSHELIARCFKNHASHLPGAAMDLWNRLAADASDRLAERLFESLMDALEKQPDRSAPCSAKAHSKRINEATLTAFLANLSQVRFTAIVVRAGALPQKNPRLLNVEKTLLPALEAAFAGKQRPPAGLVHPLWRSAAEFYLNRSESPPPVPVDWAQSILLQSQHQPELRELELFARDPVKQVHRIRAKKEIRQTLHQTIDRLGLDITHVTERKGSPYTLVLTKTRASYERACLLHRSDLTDMRRLLALPPAEALGFSEIADRMLAACRRA